MRSRLLTHGEYDLCFGHTSHRNRPRRLQQRKQVVKSDVPLCRWLIKAHDLVEVNQGPEEGRRGHVMKRSLRGGTVCVEGVNVRVVEEIDPEGSSIFDPTYAVKKEAQPIPSSHVSLIDPTTDKCTSAEWRRRADGRWARVSIATGTGGMRLHMKFLDPSLQEQHRDACADSRCSLVCCRNPTPS